MAEASVIPLGKMLTKTLTGTTGTVVQGVQQPFEIQTVLGVENFNINLNMNVYPNPTTNFLSLEISNYNSDTISYQLFDLNGRLLANKSISTVTTLIGMEKYPLAIYLLKVVNNNKEVKTFKIIKNQ